MNLLKKYNQKPLIGLMAGAVFLGGAMAPYIVQAAQKTDTSPQTETRQQQRQQQPPKMDMDKVAQNIADTFGVNKDEVASYMKNNQGDFRDIFRGAMLSKVSGKSFSDIMAMKTSSNKWQDVEKSLGITHEQMRQAQDDMVAVQLEQKASIAKDTTKSLMQQGYHPDDIAAAGILAQKSGKTINDVLAMKKINNSWKDVAKSLNIDEKTFKESMKDIGGMHGDHHGAPPQDGPRDMQSGGPQGGPPQGDSENGGTPPEAPESQSAE